MIGFLALLIPPPITLPVEESSQVTTGYHTLKRFREVISTVLSAVDLGIIFGGRRVKPRIARILQQSRIPRSVLMIYILASTSRGFTMYMANVLTRKGLPDTAPTILTLGLFKMKCRKTGSLAQDPYRQANRSRLRNHEPHPVAALLVDTC